MRFPRQEKLLFACALVACLASVLLALPAFTVWLGLPPEGDAVDYRVPLLRWIVANRALPNWPWTFVEDYPALGDIAMAILFALSPHLMRLAPLFGYVACAYFAGRIFVRLSEEQGPVDRRAAFLTAAAWTLGLRPLALQSNLLMLDTLAAAFTLGALYYFLARKPGRSGLWAALALSTRFTTWANMAVLGLLQLVRDRGSLRKLWPFFLVAGCGALPWMIRNWIVNRNPVFPLATGLFNGQPLTVFDAYGRGKDPLSLLLLPFDILYTNSYVSGMFDYTIGKLFYAQLGATLLAAAWKPRAFLALFPPLWRSPSCRYLLLFTLLHVLTWFFSSQQLRFLSVALLLLNLLMLHFCFRLLPPLLLGAVTLLGVYAAVSIQKDSIFIALGKQESFFSPFVREAGDCFSRAGVTDSSLVGHFSRDNTLGFFSHSFVYGGKSSFFLVMQPGYAPPVPDFVYDPYGVNRLDESYRPWPPERPCLWKRI